jgi:hypothetical protein
MRRFVPDRETVLVVALLLTAVIAGFLLRIPSHPLLSYGSTAILRASRTHHLPSYAILSDLFCTAVLVILPIVGTGLLIEHHAPVGNVLAVDHPIAALRC